MEKWAQNDVKKAMEKHEKTVLSDMFNHFQLKKTLGTAQDKKPAVAITGAQNAAAPAPEQRAAVLSAHVDSVPIVVGLIVVV